MCAEIYNNEIEKFFELDNLNRTVNRIAWGEVNLLQEVVMECIRRKSVDQ